MHKKMPKGMGLSSIKSPRRTVELICHGSENSSTTQDIAFKNGAFWTYNRKLSLCKTPFSVAQESEEYEKHFLKKQWNAGKSGKEIEISRMPAKGFYYSIRQN